MVLGTAEPTNVFGVARYGRPVRGGSRAVQGRSLQNHAVRGEGAVERALGGPSRGCKVRETHRQLSDDQVARLAGLFDELADAEFERLPDMTNCPARTALDDDLSDILGLSNLSTLRHLLATEPVVSNRRL